MSLDLCLMCDTFPAGPNGRDCDLCEKETRSLREIDFGRKPEPMSERIRPAPTQGDKTP